MPSPYGPFIKYLSALSLDLVQIMPADCVVENSWSHYDSLLVETMTPILVLVLILFTYVIQLVRCVSVRAEHKRIGRFLVVIILVLPTISRRICQTFQCRIYDDGDFSLLVSDLATSCVGAKYDFFYYYSALMVCIYPLGVPLVFWAGWKFLVVRASRRLPL